MHKPNPRSNDPVHCNTQIPMKKSRSRMWRTWKLNFSWVLEDPDAYLLSNWYQGFFSRVPALKSTLPRHVICPIRLVINISFSYKVPRQPLLKPSTFSCFCPKRSITSNPTVPAFSLISPANRAPHFIPQCFRRPNHERIDKMEIEQQSAARRRLRNTPSKRRRKPLTAAAAPESAIRCPPISTYLALPGACWRDEGARSR